MPEPKPIPLNFPLNGINVVHEFQLQPPGTTADALNVRSRDAIARRNRGGSRPGLGKYIAQQIPEGAKTIQHLNYIVDPTTDALPQNFITPGDDWIESPIPGVFVPPGGAPWQPNPNVPNQPPGDIAFVQKKTAFDTINDVSTGEFTVVFDTQPVSGHLLVVAITSTVQDLDASGEDVVTVAVMNNAAAAYTQIGSYISANGTVTSSGVVNYRRISLWYRVSTGVVADKTVKIDYSPDTLAVNVADVHAECVEYKNTDSSPFNATANASSNAAITSLSIGPVAMTDRGMLICVLAGSLGQQGSAITPSPYMTLRFPITNTINFFDRHPLFLATTVVFSFQQFGFDSGGGVAIIAASFKKAP